MKKSILLTIFSIILVTAALGWTQPPLKEEHFVYGLNSFNGKGYKGSFCPPAEDTLYLIANENNIISPRMTLIYFWPITGQYMAAWQTLNEDVAGKLEILKDGKVIQTLEKRKYVFVYPEGYFAEICQLALDQEAEKQHEAYQKLMKEFWEKVKKYYEEQEAYRKKFDEFLRKVKERDKAGKKYRIEPPLQPKEPEAPRLYATSPATAFIVNLDLGTYEIRVRAPDGTIVEESKKKIITFNARRRGGIGYEIIPGNRWTRQESCDDPSEVIYLEGRNFLYFRPFFQDEYNELAYNKLEDPQNKGNRERWRWVHIRPKGDVYLELLKEGKVIKKVEKKQYYVQQIPGYELGYNILEFKKEEHERPDFEGYKLDLEVKGEKGQYEVRLVDSKGQVVEGSRREISPVRKEAMGTLYLPPLIPIVVGAAIFVWRRKK